MIPIQENNKKLARLWLIQSVGALAFSGLFAIFLVIARSPKVGKLLPYEDFFRTSLTIHVNLSVLIWLTSIITTIFALNTKYIKIGYLGLLFCSIGTIIITLSIFDFSAHAYLNNYLPMLDAKLFKLGIAIYLIGIFIASFQAVSCFSEFKIFRVFCQTSFLIIMASYIVLVLTMLKLNSPENIVLYNFEDYYERLFWGFGHMIQFLYLNAVIFSVFFLIDRISDKQNSKFILNAKTCIFYLNLVLAASGIYIILVFDVTSFEYIDFYTKQMVMFGGVAATLAFLIFMPQLINNYKKFAINKPVRNAIIWSIILFLAGGIISMFISGVNTIIPAHYHGSIVGVSLGLMAITYYIMPKIGYGEISGRMANLQPIFYGSGQLLHIIGFAISGGYGAMRKMPGQELPAEAKIYMGLMGMGGLISIIGGLFFVIVIFKAIIKFRRK